MKSTKAIVFRKTKITAGMLNSTMMEALYNEATIKSMGYPLQIDRRASPLVSILSSNQAEYIIFVDELKFIYL
jgi:hypothetical protein